MGGFLRCLVGVVSLLAAFHARADSIFADSAQFHAALAVPPSFEGFEGLLVPLGTSPIPVGDLTATGGPASHIGISDTPVNGLHPTEGSNFLFWDALVTDATITFVFESPIRAFGVEFNDALDGLGGVLSLETETGVSFPSFLSGTFPSGDEQFVGIIADAPFLELTLTNSSGTDGVAFDALSYSPIPEPTTHLLSLLGTLGLALVRNSCLR